jgi:type III restriction enzyme
VLWTLSYPAPSEELWIRHLRTNHLEVLGLGKRGIREEGLEDYIVSGFKRCLYREQKFQSDSERKMAVILDREALKWFRPAKGQFSIYYRWLGDHPEYQPDFVAETEKAVYMVETKARADMESSEVLAKKESALRWCEQASDYARTHDGKPWQYLLIPDDVIFENMTLAWLADRFDIGV